MHHPLPETLVPRRAAQQALALAGTVPPSALPRLSEAFDLGGPVTVALNFSQLDEHSVRLTGKLATTVRLHCQRCLEWFETALEADVDVEFGPARAEPETDREIVAGDDQPLALTEFVEDELLLSAPMVATHPEAACFPPGELRETLSTGAVRRPFGELGHLLGRKEPD